MLNGRIVLLAQALTFAADEQSASDSLVNGHGGYLASRPGQFQWGQHVSVGEVLAPLRPIEIVASLGSDARSMMPNNELWVQATIRTRGEIWLAQIVEARPDELADYELLCRRPSRNRGRVDSTMLPIRCRSSTIGFQQVVDHLVVVVFYRK